MAKNKNKAKTIDMYIPVSDETHAIIKARANLRGISMASYVRLVLGIPQLRKYKIRHKS
jgi:hypothetical protein